MFNQLNYLIMEYRVLDHDRHNFEEFWSIVNFLKIRNLYDESFHLAHKLILITDEAYNILTSKVVSIHIHVCYISINPNL